jgi:D-alanyl-D-alanine carboxypeptidase
MLTLALLVAACGGDRAQRASAPSGPRLTPQLARTLDMRLRAAVARTFVAGATAAIVFPDGREWSGATGAAILHPRTPMTTRTTIAFDSVTKSATAALAMRLAEQGRLRLNDPIRRWYAAWRGDPRATVRDLLGHTVGVADPSDRFLRSIVDHPHRPVTPAQTVAATRRPGPRTDEAEYSNTGFALAGIILRRAAGEPVATAMRRELFGAPGGDGLAMQPAERPHPPLAHAYFYPESGATPVDANASGPFVPSRAWAGAVSTAGALAGDAPSLARWAHALLGGHILKPASLRAMSRFHPGAFWDAGLGLALSSIDDRPMWGHNGDGHGTHTELWHLPKEHVTIAISWNDDAVEFDTPFVPDLLHTVLGSA